MSKNRTAIKTLPLHKAALALVNATLLRVLIIIVSGLILAWLVSNLAFSFLSGVPFVNLDFGSRNGLYLLFGIGQPVNVLVLTSLYTAILNSMMNASAAGQKKFIFKAWLTIFILFFIAIGLASVFLMIMSMAVFAAVVIPVVFLSCALVPSLALSTSASIPQCFILNFRFYFFFKTQVPLVACTPIACLAFGQLILWAATSLAMAGSSPMLTIPLVLSGFAFAIFTYFAFLWSNAYLLLLVQRNSNA